MRPGMHGKTKRSRSLIQMADRRERDGVSCSEDAYHDEGWSAAAMVAAAWLRFSAIDRTNASRVWNETRARKTVQGEKMLQESAAVGARVERHS